MDSCLSRRNHSKTPCDRSGICGLALHHYAWDLSRGIPQIGTTGNGDAIKFEPVDWYELLHEGNLMEGLIEGPPFNPREFEDVSLCCDPDRLFRLCCQHNGIGSLKSYN